MPFLSSIWQSQSIEQNSEHWPQFGKITHGPYLFVVHSRIPLGRGVAPFVHAVWCCNLFEYRGRPLVTWRRLFLTPPRRICFCRCLFICLLATLRKYFQMDLHEIFREGWLWASEQMIKFLWQSTNRLLPVSILPLPTVEINVTSLASGCTLYCCNHTYNGLTFIFRRTSDTWLPLWWIMNFCSWVVPFMMPIKEHLMNIVLFFTATNFPQFDSVASCGSGKLQLFFLC